LFLAIIALKILFLRARFSLYKAYKNLRSSSIFRSNYLTVFAWDNSENSIKWRTTVLVAAFFIVYCVVALKLIMVASSVYVNKIGAFNKTDAARVDIIDRNGNLLAVNLPAASLFANPTKVLEPELAVEKLQKIFPDLDKQRLLEQLKSDKRFVWIKRDIMPKEQETIYNLGMPGFEFEREQKRIYTYGNLFSHVLGYVGRDMEGLAGVEKYFDKFLSGQEKAAKGTLSGRSLQLSLDTRMQSILHEEIDLIIKKFSAKGASGILVDPNNGEVIALVSKPDFDPHYPGSAKAESLFNMATQGVYEMGSGMKALTLAIGLDAKATSMRDAYDLTYMKVGKFRVKDYHTLKGWHTVPEIFLNSSNIGVSQIMLEIGRINLRKYLKKLKLMARLDIDLPREPDHYFRLTQGGLI